jgi:hypothetical protein
MEGLVWNACRALTMPDGKTILFLYYNKRKIGSIFRHKLTHILINL